MKVEVMAEGDDVSLDDVLVFRVGDRHCKIAPPRHGEPVEITALKNFMMACLHRRNLDDEFEDDMKNWINSYTFDEFKDAVEKRSPPSRSN